MATKHSEVRKDIEGAIAPLKSHTQVLYATQNKEPGDEFVRITYSDGNSEMIEFQAKHITSGLIVVQMGSKKSGRGRLDDLADLVSDALSNKSLPNGVRTGQGRTGIVSLDPTTGHSMCNYSIPYEYNAN